MSIKLRDLIRAVRAAKTAAEERAVISKECALCRSSFAERDVKNRHRNVAKLLYIHMLGYPTHFAQKEALFLIASNKFSDKRIGYLGLMLLLDERQQVLMLVTNSLKQDFSNRNVFVVGLALSAIGNVASADMSRDLSNEVEAFFRHPNPYLRKKACLTAIRCVRKVPELVEDFIAGASGLLTDRSHAVQLCAVSLIIEMIKLDPSVTEQFRKMVRTLVRLLSNVRAQVADFDGNGVSDPFLQIKLMHLLRLLGKGDAEASEYMNEILAQVAINTTDPKNPGYAVLYECVMTIMSIESEGGLRTVAINILGRFLVNQNNNNIRYVALSTLCKLVNRDTQAIQRHRNTIVDCLKDPDISIRRRALDLIYALVTKANVVALVKELLNYLSLTTGDKEFKTDLTEKICVVIERFSPNEQWHIDTVIEVLSTAGAYAQPHVVTDLIALVSQTDELYAYSVHKLYDCLKKIKPNQFSLAQVAVWAVGEFGELLTSTEGAQAASIEGSDMKFAPVEEMAVIAIFKKLATHPSADVLIKQYILTALAKLIRRFTDSQGLIPSLISSFNTSIVVELQQRSIEYAALAANDHASFRPRILDRMPKFESKTKVLDAESSGSSESDESDEEEDAPTEPAVVAAETPVPETVVPDIMDIFGGAVANTVPDSNPAPVVAPVADGAVDLMSMFGQPAQPQPAQPVQPVAPVVQQQPDLMGLFDMGGMAPAPVVQPTQPPVYDSPNVSIFFSHNVNPATPHICETKALFRSKQANLSNFMFYCAFPKFLAHTMEQASGSELPLGGSVTQSFVITNSLHGKKRPVIRIRLNYLLNGQPQEETGQINSFP